MNLALIISLGVLALVLLAMSIIIIIMGKKQGDTNPTIMDKIRPLISQTLIQAMVFYQASEEGYEEFELAVLTWLKGQIDNADFLTDVEKTFLSYDLLKQFIGPQLQKLWDNGQLAQLTCEAGYLLEKAQ